MLVEGQGGLVLETAGIGTKGTGAARLRPAEAFSPMPLGRGRISPIVISGAVRILEFIVVCLTGAAIAWVYLPVEVSARPYWVALPGAAALTLVAFRLLDIDQPGALRNFVGSAWKVVAGFALVFLVLFALVFFLKFEGAFSRVVFAAWFVFGLAALLALRFVVHLAVKAMTARGLLDRRAAIVGGGATAEALLEALTRDKDSDLRIVGLFDDRTDGRSPDLVAGYPKLGGIDELIGYARNARLDTIIFALPVTAEARILDMLKRVCVLPVDIRLAAHTQQLRFKPRNYSYLGSMPVFDMADRPVADWGLVWKAAFDRVAGALLLLALTPLMLLIALAVKLDSRGPVLFRQKRYGFNNQMIEVFKFRSMYVEQTDATAARLVTRDDPRVTRVGRFLRKASLDELPQLFNVVFRGDLSLVGPRPHAVHAKAEDRLYDEVVEGYFARHKVKPGITGWAQVNGWRGETDTHEKIQKRVEHDLFYIENWSLAFDFYILLLTPFALIKSENAY